MTYQRFIQACRIAREGTEEKITETQRGMSVDEVNAYLAARREGKEKGLDI